MEVAQPALASASTLNLSLHPLVIINVSDHFTRVKAQSNTGSSSSAGLRVAGVLLGTQVGRNVEIFNSFELKHTTDSTGKVTFDHEFAKIKEEQYKKVFPNFEMLGWYATGGTPDEKDVETHKEVSQLIQNECPLLLTLDASSAHNAKELPIAIYESEVHVVNNVPTMTFAQTTYKFETVEAERISVDHVANITPSGASGASMLTAHLGGLHNAIKMLHMRLKVVRQFLESTAKGEIAADHQLLRQVASLCTRLPAIDTPQFKEDFTMDYNDVLLVTYLATLTKGANQVNELVDKFNVTYDRHSRRRYVF